MISKIVFIVLASMFSNGLYAAADQQPVDEYVTSFVQSMKSEKVLQQEDHVLLLAEWPFINTIGCMFLGCNVLALGGVGIAGVWVSDSWFGKIASAGIVGISAALINMIVTSIKNHNDPEKPYLLFSNEGFKYNNNRFIAWNEIENLNVQATAWTHDTMAVHGDYVGGSHGVSRQIRSLVVSDRFRSVLFSMSQSDLYLPISFDNLVAIFEHYWNKSRSKGNERVKPVVLKKIRHSTT